MTPEQAEKMACEAMHAEESRQLTNCQHELRRALAKANAYEKALGVAESALEDMTQAFEWGSTSSVGAGVGRCKAGLAAVRAALSKGRET